jgi:hypothetical protein
MMGLAPSSSIRPGFSLSIFVFNHLLTIFSWIIMPYVVVIISLTTYPVVDGGSRLFIIINRLISTVFTPFDAMPKIIDVFLSIIVLWIFGFFYFDE